MTDESAHILAHRDGAVGIITIDRTSRFNSLDVHTAQALQRATLEFARGDDVRVVVLRGAGGVFCSGADVKYVNAGGDARDPGYLQPETRPNPGGFGEGFRQILESLHGTISEIRRSPKPFIAAVDGLAAAGGFGLAMSCDLVLCSPRATFEWAYSRTGLTGAESSTFFLPRLIGLRRSMELVLLNPRLDATRAVDMGLVSAVYPLELFADEVLGVARRIASGPTQGYAVAKALLNHAAGVDRLDYHLDQELENLARSADGVEFTDGPDMFLGKRAPNFEER